MPELDRIEVSAADLAAALEGRRVTVADDEGETTGTLANPAIIAELLYRTLSANVGRRQAPDAAQPDYGAMCAVPLDCPNGPDDHPFVMAERGRNWCTQLIEGSVCRHCLFDVWPDPGGWRRYLGPGDPWACEDNPDGGHEPAAPGELATDAEALRDEQAAAAGAVDAARDAREAWNDPDAY